MTVVYHLEERGASTSLYHLLIYVIGGLYTIPNPDYPVTVYIDTHPGPITKYIDEAFAILSDTYQLVKTLPAGKCISIYGEPCEKDGISDNPCMVFPFVRNLFLTRVTLDPMQPRRFFIGRKRSFTTGNTCNLILNRTVLNEQHFIERLKQLNIDCIYLEDYSLEDKVRLFHSAELVVSTNSSGLTGVVWCKRSAVVVEIVPGRPQTTQGSHYHRICSVLGINYKKYTDIVTDENDNFTIEDNDDIYEYLRLV